MTTPTSKTYLYSLVLIFIYMFSGRLEANLKTTILHLISDGQRVFLITKRVS